MSYSANSVSLIVYENNQRRICRQQAKSLGRTRELPGFEGSPSGVDGALASRWRNSRPARQGTGLRFWCSSSHLRSERLQPDYDRFGFGVQFQRFVAHFSTPAGLFVAAERQRRVEHVVAVNPHRPGLKLSRNPMGLADIARPMPAAAIRRCVGSSNQFSGLVNGSATTTGPKISSRTMLISGSRP